MEATEPRTTADFNDGSFAMGKAVSCGECHTRDGESGQGRPERDEGRGEGARRGNAAPPRHPPHAFEAQDRWDGFQPIF